MHKCIPCFRTYKQDVSDVTLIIAALRNSAVDGESDTTKSRLQTGLSAETPPPWGGGGGEEGIDAGWI